MPNYLKQEQEILTPKLLKLAAASRRPLIDKLTDAELVTLVADLDQELSKAGPHGEGDTPTTADILLAAARRAKAALRSRGLGPRSDRGKAVAAKVLTGSAPKPAKASAKRDPITRTPKKPGRSKAQRITAKPVNVAVVPTAAARPLGTAAPKPAAPVQRAEPVVASPAAPAPSQNTVQAKDEKSRKKPKSSQEKQDAKDARKAAKKSARLAERAARKAARVAERELRKAARKAARKAEREAAKVMTGADKDSKKSKDKGKDKKKKSEL